MQDYNQLTAHLVPYFKDEARKAFAPICSSFGLQEEDVILRDIDNRFQITFSNSKIRIVIEGRNWGMNTNIYLQINTRDSDRYSIEELINERKPEIPIAGGQIDQLYAYADYLMKYATDILEGDTTFFSQQEAMRKQEKENARIAMEAEATRKISEGYLKIDPPFGAPVWRKPRPLLSPYSIIKDKFPNSVGVVFEDDLACFEQYEAFITNWKIELGEIVIKDEVICEISTDKVWAEIVAPQTGRLIWLLEEGIVFKFPGSIALLDPVNK
ncbi:biotin/lipoyl-containing protein [Pedobacter cryoconitis]|uniref:Biotin carboxyl carrier protein n=1 Tax=Pedobacter cryoconitis TaxID=188932 RepID=A0A7X0MKG3_9SPHI|nr:lipoyl domain-containing protein [Pedobacter cryoconitis]MBB6502036.1 biotin carboxyl carrier protein [Pedobacter cryoconitis]